MKVICGTNSLLEAVPRVQLAIALEYVAKLLRKHPTGEIVFIYDEEDKSWEYELVERHEHRMRVGP